MREETPVASPTTTEYPSELAPSFGPLSTQRVSPEQLRAAAAVMASARREPRQISPPHPGA